MPGRLFGDTFEVFMQAMHFQELDSRVRLRSLGTRLVAVLALAWLGGCGDDDTSVASSPTVAPPVVVAPAFTTAPASQSVVAPDTASFSVVATGDPAPTLQWQVSGDGGATFSDIAGAIGSSYTTPATTVADDGNLFRAVATNAAGSATSGAAALAVTGPPPATVLALDFETSLPPQVDPGSALLEDVQGFAGLGTPGNTFGGKMLRSATANSVTVTLTGLPAHSWLSLEFLFAAIDSLDGTGVFPAGDFLEIKVDGATVFNESFANSLVTQIQSYVPPAGGELARRVELGFWSAYPESAYNMAIEPRFQRIAHTAGSVTIIFRMEGSGESLDNESWGIDNLRVVVGQ